MKKKEIIGNMLAVLAAGSILCTGCSTAKEKETVQSSVNAEDQVAAGQAQESQEAQETQGLAAVITPGEISADSSAITPPVIDGNMSPYGDRPLYDPETSPMDYVLTDFDSLENEDLIELVNIYSDNGFSVYDLNMMGMWGCAIGDEEMYFNKGFMAVRDDPYSTVYDYVMLMTEDQFNEYILDEYFISPELTDNGAAITASEEGVYVSYDRGTGICIMSMAMYEMDEYSICYSADDSTVYGDFG